MASRPERAIQPGACERPFVLHRGRRKIERAGRFLDAQAGEVPQRYDLRFTRVALFESRQRFVDGDEIGERRVRPHDRAVEFDAFGVAAVLHPLIMPRALDENAAHRQRRGGKEMTASVPAAVAAVAGDAQVRFVDERSRLERLIRPALTRESRSRQFSQFVIDFRQHLVRSAGAAVRRVVAETSEREL